MAKDDVIAFSLRKERAVRQAGPSPDQELRYSVILQGTFDSAAAREEFLEAFSHIGLKLLSCAFLFPNLAQITTERQTRDGISRVLSKFMEIQKHEEMAE